MNILNLGKSPLNKILQKQMITIITQQSIYRVIVYCFAMSIVTELVFNGIVWDIDWDYPWPGIPLAATNT